MANRVNYICQNCGSDNLVYDASAEWDVDAQKMELRDTYDSKPTCQDCEYVGWAEKVELDAEPKIKFNPDAVWPFR